MRNGNTYNRPEVHLLGPSPNESRPCFPSKLRLYNENHEQTLAIYFRHYNLCHGHQTLRVSPAMEGGIANHVWETAELMALSESKSILDGLIAYYAQ